MSFIGPVVTEQYFGVLLKPHWPTDPITFAVVKTYKGEIIDSKKYNSREFILMATGEQSTAANPKSIDFFEEFDIPNCIAYYDSVFTEHVVICPTVNNLWKLRYQKKPGDYSEGNIDEAAEKGWAHKKFSPDKFQMSMLSEFGINSLNDYAFGDNCFKLIKATTDPTWIKEYVE